VAVLKEGAYGKMTVVTENVGCTVEGLIKAFEITKQRK
jgi:Ras-related GTP-binding protein C/D